MSQKPKGRRFSKEFRESAVRRLGETANVSELCRELGISRQLLYWWRERVERERRGHFLAVEQGLRQENAQLKKALAKKTLEADFLKAACEKVEALRQTATGCGETASGKPSGN
jgi:transposase-like protein